MTPRRQGQNCRFYTTPLSHNSQKRLQLKETQTKYRKMTRKPKNHVTTSICRTWAILPVKQSCHDKKLYIEKQTEDNHIIVISQVPLIFNYFGNQIIAYFQTEVDWVQVGVLWDKQHETRAPNEIHIVRKSPLTLGKISRANIEGRLYLAEFMKTAPAGSWRPHTLN